MSEPTVTLMTNDLPDRIRRERESSDVSGGGGNRYLISCKNPWSRRWSYMIIGVAIYSVVVIPMKMAVYRNLLGPYYDAIDIFTYILYILDVIINCRTSYLDIFGEEIKDSSKIFWHYVGGVGFWIDLASLLNYPLATSPILSIIGILKVNRFLRISTLIGQSNME